MRDDGLVPPDVLCAVYVFRGGVSLERYTPVQTPLTCGTATPISLISSAMQKSTRARTSRVACLSRGVFCAAAAKGAGFSSLGQVGRLIKGRLMEHVAGRQARPFLSQTNPSTCRLTMTTLPPASCVTSGSSLEGAICRLVPNTRASVCTRGQRCRGAE